MKYDVLIVGGGINGVGIAADAAARGLSTLLCEMDDLASATSSNSSKLIHGGLRYLEHYEFRLVREALAEREVLLQKAPHIMWPMRFRLPHQAHLRPAWMIRIGLFLYDHLAKRLTLKGSKGIRFDESSPIVSELRKGFEYSDCWVDDARLVVLNAVAARNSGAKILTRTACVSAKRKDGDWQVQLKSLQTGEVETVSANVLVNAAGPWVTDFFDKSLAKPAPKKIRLVKGSHIVVPKIHQRPEAYILQNKDQRIVFVIPYEDKFSLIGTTDVEHQADAAEACISKKEIDYLVSITNAYFKQKITAEDVVHSYSGVRPLLDDGETDPDKVTRDYTFEVEKPEGQALLLSIFGGKITTYRKLAEAAVDEIVECFPHAKPCDTDKVPLPGGDFGAQETLAEQLYQQCPWLHDAIIKRYVRSYGTLSFGILKGCQSIKDMGDHFGAGLYQKEVEYLIAQEWALSVEDIIWRRTKIGLLLNDQGKEKLRKFM